VKPEAETPTNAVPAEGEGAAAVTPNAAPPPENSGLDRKTALIIGAAILLVAGGLAFFMWRRASIVSHGSLISSAMKVTKYEDKVDEKVEDDAGDQVEEKNEPGTEMTSEPEPEAKKEEKIFPPPMN
jgi:hypothetical protein